MSFSNISHQMMTKKLEIGMTADLSNFDQRWSDAQFVSFLIYYYCKGGFSMKSILKSWCDKKSF